MTSLIDRWNSISHPRICVIGDLILDCYHWGAAERISPEAPVLVLRSEGEEDRLGGAASVASLLRGLECDVSLIGIVGDDVEGRRVKTLVAEMGVDASPILVDASRPTTKKTRILGSTNQRQPHQLLRLDRESTQPVGDELEQLLIEVVGLAIPQASMVLVSDYGKGCCTPELLRTIFDVAGRHGIPVAVDPAKNVSYDRYRNASILTPNRTEASTATGTKIHTSVDAANAGRKLCLDLDIDTVLLKLDREGLVICNRTDPPQVVQTIPRTVCDVTGAGDMVLAVLGLCLADGWALSDAAEIANVAAGLEVERVGVTQISREEIAASLRAAKSRTTHQKVVSCEFAGELAVRYRQEGRKIAFTNGCFDLFHAGHLHSLEQAGSHGDILFVAVNDDSSISRLKGSGRPIIPQEQRLAIVAALSCVDHVILMDDDTPHRILNSVRPHVLAKGAPYTPSQVVGGEIVLEYGGTIAITETLPNLSTTLLQARIATGSSEEPLRFSDTPV
jgi:D-beta-D-heptose 7-phosphate kinase/D-beta-D-heptose 1-phosphate adenosyltransferase